MADQENTLPPSKKRAAGREISRDNPGLDDEEETSEQETGTFKRASEEVIATRRIVKVRKHQTTAPSAPSSNPFASIRLVPPPGPSAAASGTPEKVDSGKTVPEQVAEKSDLVKENLEAEDDNSKQTENKVEVGTESVADEKKLDAVNEESKPEPADKVAEEKEDETEDESKKDDSVEKKDNGKESSALGASSFGSFHQLSSSQNAFTGVAGTGFSSSTFSFGSINKEGSPLGSVTTISGSSFGTTIGFSFPSNGSSSIFATPGGSTGSKIEGTGVPALKEVPVETGEENEKVVFTADSVLFEYIDGGWKERGKGELKVNVSTTSTQTGKARLVMRARGNYRLILNASLFPDMKLANMDKKGITFACVNSTGEEGKEGFSTFALKFKDGSIAEEFRAAVIEHKGPPNNTAAAKTPENSPKTSADDQV